MNEIVDIVCAYVGMIIHTEPQKWFWDEEREIQSSAFRFESREDSYVVFEREAREFK